MSGRGRPLRLALLAVAVAAAPGRLAAQPDGGSWPHWLGPTQNGSAVEPGLLAGRPTARLEKLWSRPLETGHAGIAVAEGLAYTLFSDGRDEYAIALAVEDGREAWRAKLDPDRERAFLPGPTTIPAFHEGRLFTLSSRCRLRAHDAATGRELWRIDATEAYGMALPMGCGPAPFVEAGRLFLVTPGSPDRSLVALDPASGERLFEARTSERVGATSPVAAAVAGVRQLLVRLAAGPLASGLASLRLSDGATLWSAGHAPGFSFDTPLALAGDRVLVTTANQSHLLRILREGERWRAEPLWTSGDLQSGVGPPVFHDGHLFGYAGDDLVCVDAATGAAAWRERTYPGSLLLLDGHLVALSTSAGLLRLVEAGAAGYREKARLALFARGAQGWAPPSYAGRRLFLRNEEEIAAVAVR